MEERDDEGEWRGIVKGSGKGKEGRERRGKGRKGGGRGQVKEGRRGRGKGRKEGGER